MKTMMIAIALSLSAAFSALAGTDTVRFVTEEYAPFNFSKDGAIVGIAAEQVRTIARDAGIEHSIDIMPWARAIATAESQPMHCVFTTGYNRNRSPRFVWITPLLKDQMLLLKHKGSNIEVSTLDDARKLRVGSQRGDFAVEALEELGFENIDLATDIELTLRKLVSDRIDLMPTSVKTFKALVDDGQPVEKVMLLSGQVYGIACNKDMPAEITQRLQAALDALIVDGRQDQIFADYGLPPNTRTAENGKGN